MLYLSELHYEGTVQSVYSALNKIVSSHTDAIHIGAMEIDGSRMTIPR